jgi:hypothetical protein
MMGLGLWGVVGEKGPKEEHRVQRRARLLYGGPPKHLADVLKVAEL